MLLTMRTFLVLAKLHKLEALDLSGFEYMMHILAFKNMNPFYLGNDTFLVAHL